MDFNKTLAKLLGNDKKIDEVQIDQKVIDEIIKIARNSDPKEYVALLAGKIDHNILKITGLIFLPYASSNTSAVMQIFMKPMTTDAVGSVHSHPGPSAQPSNADLQFFGKNGFFHMIICQPYTQSTICAYDAAGTPMPFTITDLGDDIDIKTLDDLDLDSELFDQEFIDELNSDNDVDGNVDMIQDAEIVSDDKVDIVEDNDIISNNDNIIQDNNKIEPQIPKMVDIQLEVNGEIINQQIPLPPEFEPGDDLEVDIRTDITPGNSVDEIKLNVIKSQENLLKNNNIKDEIIEIPQESSHSKSIEEIDKEIKAMESEIERIKEENKRLRNSCDE